MILKSLSFYGHIAKIQHSVLLLIRDKELSFW